MVKLVVIPVMIAFLEFDIEDLDRYCLFPRAEHNMRSGRRFQACPEQFSPQQYLFSYAGNEISMDQQQLRGDRLPGNQGVNRPNRTLLCYNRTTS